MNAVKTVERIERKIVDLQSTMPRCEHKQIVGRCPYCDKCEHGVNTQSDCRACHANDDPAWKTAPVSDAEIVQLRRWFAAYERQYLSPHAAVRRYTPFGKRNFRDTEVSFLPILLGEYERLRAAAKTQSTATSEASALTQT